MRGGWWGDEGEGGGVMRVRVVGDEGEGGGVMRVRVSTFMFLFPSVITPPGLNARLQQMDGTWPLPRQRDLPEDWIGVSVSHKHVHV